MKKRIYILGGGAIGTALAVFLTRREQDVTLVRTRSGMESAWKKFSATSGSESYSANVAVTSLGAITTFDGVIIVTTKSFVNQVIAEQLRAKSNNFPIVIFQNGLNVEQPFLDAGFSHVYRCVLFFTSQHLDADNIRFKPVSVSPIGIVRGNEDELNATVDLINSSQFPFEAVKDIAPVVWIKTITNCIFNSICPLLDTDNGIFHRDLAARDMAMTVVKECVGVALACGMKISENDVMDTVLRISKASDGILISTLQDIRAKRPTEIGSLNFAIADVAAKLHLSDLPRTTKMLGELTKLKSALTINQ